MKRSLVRLLCACSVISIVGLIATESSSRSPVALALRTSDVSSRDLFLQPFSDSSPWNTPIGSSAQYSSADDPSTVNLHNGDSNIAAGSWSIPVYLASSSDPVVTLTDPSGSTTLHMPTNAVQAAGTDATIAVVDPTKTFVDESWMTSPAGGGNWTSQYHVRNDLRGEGISGGIHGAQVSGLGGLLRAWEVEQGSIQHPLAVALAGSQLRSGWVWPAKGEDSNSSWSYTGLIPQGSLVAIPATVDLSSLGLNPDALVLARALQGYGAYVVDQSTGLRIFAEPAAESVRLDNMRADLDKIVAQLRVVTNNGPGSVGGGGTPITGGGAAPSPSAAAGGGTSASSVFAFGQAQSFGSTAGLRLAAPIVGMTATPSGNGYWEVAADGGVFAFGDAQYLGSTAGRRLNSWIVGITATPSGKGYWEVAADGGVFAFGDAQYLGSVGNMRLNAPIVGISASPSGTGYWEVASDGGVFAFGDARYAGSVGGRLNAPIVGITATPSGNGYWEVAADGGVFAYGAARYMGSTGSMRLNAGVVGIAAAPNGNGYWEVAADGGVFAFGDAVYPGSPIENLRGHQVTGVAATNSGAGYWIVTR